MIVPFASAVPRARLVQSEHLPGQHPESLEFVTAKVLLIVLRKAVDEERVLAPAKQHDGAEPAESALSSSRDALLDDPTAEIGIDQVPSRRIGSGPRLAAATASRATLLYAGARREFVLGREQGGGRPFRPGFPT